MKDSNDKNKVIVERIEEAINNISNKKFTLYFFVVDSKNVPNGSTSYIYNLAYTLQEIGYDVCMLYQLENEYNPQELEELRAKDNYIDENRVFVGVKDWMGEKYANLKHINIMREGSWSVTASDFLFIPEVFSSLMFQTYNLHVPCKRYAILQNFNYISEFIPFGKEWGSYGIVDAITSTQKQSELLKGIFPYVKTKVINPYIPDYFRKGIKPQKLIVNVIAKNQSDVHRVIKEFYWKYPIYKFVSFRDLRNFPRTEFAEALKESAISVWLDETTPFGYSPLEAMRCGNIVVGKIPNDVPEWMTDENGMLSDNGIWFNNLNDLGEILSKVIGSWMQDEIPLVLTEAMDKTNERYTYDTYLTTVTEMFEKMCNERIIELNAVKSAALSKIKQ